MSRSRSSSGHYFKGKPVVLSLVYYTPARCFVIRSQRHVSCTRSINAGEQFEVVNVSFDPKDTPAIAAAKQTYIKAYNRATAAKRRGIF
jgi:protein SCO1/2